MYVLSNFTTAVRSLVRDHTELDVDIRLSPIVKLRVNGHIRFYLNKNLQDLIEKLIENFTAIDHCSWSADYISIWIKKELWISKVVREILASGSKYGYNNDLKNTVILITTDEFDDSVTCLRMALLKKTIENVAKINGCIVGSNGLDLLVSKKNNKKTTNLILCGSVVCNTTANEYKQQKQNTIAKMSANRIESDEYPLNIISNLCYASIIYELLSVRHNKVVHTECDASKKDNGIFIMYNFSRLCQVWAAYEKGVIENHYQVLPDVDIINFGLLTSEEEWLLIFNCLSVYPSVIQESVKYLLSSIVDVHKLCKFLMEMSSAVSLFYHRHHILSDPISSLLPTMYARLYLVKTSIQVYENVFQLLGIETVREM